MQACPGYVLHHQLVFSLRKSAGTIPEYFRNQNWKTEKLFFPERSRKRFSTWIQFFSFGSGTIWKTEKLDAYKQIVVLASMSWLCTSSSASFFHYGKVPELFRNTSGTKTEKLKNCFFHRDPGRDSPYGFSFSVFQFWFGNYLKNWKTESIWRISSWISLEKTVFQFWFRKYSGIFAEKLKNCFFQRDPGRDSPYGFSFSVFQFWFGNYSGIFAEKLKNCFFQRDPGRDSPYGFSFSVFQFWFGNYSGILAEKLKNCFSREIQEEILHMDLVFQFFSFIASNRAGTSVQFFFESLFITCHLFCIYHLHMVPPQKKLPKSRGQNVRETL